MIAPQPPRVCVVVVNYNGRDHLEPFLKSVAEQTYPSDAVEVCVVDNGSTDGSVEYLRAAHPTVRLIVNRENLGFARPNNQAAETTTANYLALLNNDMRLAPDWIARMVNFLEAGPHDVTCAGSRILNWDGSHVDFIGGTMAFNGMGFQPGFQLPVEAPEARRYPDELLFACGGAMLIRRQVFVEAGGFDPDYFAYYEDVDLGWRLWVLGHRVRFCPEAVVYHRHNGTSSRFDWRKKVVLFERNALFSVIKNYEEETLHRVLPAVLLLGFKRLAARSGIDREAFRFGPAIARTPPSTPPETPWQKTLKNLRRLGPKTTLRKIVVALARQALRRWGGQQDEMDATTSIMREAYASVVGMEDVIDALPQLLDKRRTIQARRRRPDAEIFRLFGEPLTPVEGRPAYVEGHHQVVSAFGLDELFSLAGADVR
jgi:GT2 family glycosyltransferase